MQHEKSDSLLTPSPVNYDIKDISGKSPAWVISKARRRPLNFESYTKNCGFYKYKSFIGEGPKYTISKKYSKEEILANKRNKNEEKPTPGPGSYNIKSDLGGPKYTIGLKRVTKSLSQSNIIPGVGSYNLRKEESLVVPSYRFDSEKRNNLEMNTVNKNFPGPGNYKEVTALETKGFKYTFPQQGRFTKIKPRNAKMVRLKVPGPGSYNIRFLIGNEGPKYTFNKVKYSHSDEIDENMKTRTNYPSPGTYLKKIEYVPDTPKYTIPKFDKSKIKKRNPGPGPFEYNPNIETNSVFKKVTNVIISKASRDENEVKNPKYKKIIIPGPGQYDIKNGEFPQGPSYTIPHLMRKIKIKVEPGPADYNANENHRSKEPSYTIGKGPRDDFIRGLKKDNYPGPGAYNTIEHNSSPKYTFPKDNINAHKKFVVPGPGFYKIPTAFDFVNDMARNTGSFDPNFKYV